MKKLLLLITFVINSLALTTPTNHIVQTLWLEKNLNNENLVLIDTRSKKEYKKSHLKNAINFPKATWFQGKLGSVPKMFNTPEQFSKMFAKAGVKENSLVVFYSGGKLNKDFADAASGLWNAWLYGFQNTAILNGGFEKWTHEKKEITTAKTTIEASDFEVESFAKSIIASLNDVMQARYDDEIQISDARVIKFYKGEDKRKDLQRHGRIPSAKLTPMIRQTKKTKTYFEFLNKGEASKVLNNSDFGLELDKSAIVYCNTGHKARGLWFISKFIVGMEDVKVYDASMVEYSRTLLAMEDGEAMD